MKLRAPRHLDTWIDPCLVEALEWWDSLPGPWEPIAAHPELILDSHKIRSGVDFSLSDAWSLSTVARSLGAEQSPLILMVDDHTDLGPAWLEYSAGQMSARDLVRERETILSDPAQTEACIRSGAVGFGSWLTAALHNRQGAQVRRLHFASDPQGRLPGNYRLRCEPVDDNPARQRRRFRIVPTASSESDYWMGSNPEEWCKGLGGTDRPVFLHIDADGLNNRYNWDSDWAEAPERGQNSSRAVVEDRLQAIASVLDGTGVRLAGAHVALSPGFFPGELWSVFSETVLSRFGSLVDLAARSPQLDLEPMARPGGWWVNFAGTHVGKVSVNLGQLDRYWIDIKINKDKQGRGYSGAAFQLAARASGHSEVWARVAKSNEPSWRALLRAGFDEVEHSGDQQRVMVWRRDAAASE